MSVEAGTSGENLALASWQKRVFWSNWLGMVFEAYDLIIYALLLVPIVHYFHVPSWFGFVVLSSSYVTRGLGGLVFGHFADKLGRRSTLIVTVLGYAICTGLTGLSWSVLSLLVWRIITGFFVGGEYVSHSYVMESTPAKRRGFFSGVLLSSFSAGSLLAAISFSGYAILTHGNFVGNAWRWPFFVGVLPALIALWLRLGVVESPIWLKQHKTGTMRTSAPFFDIFKRRYLGRTLNGWAFMSGLVWVYQILIISMPSMLIFMKFPHAQIGPVVIIVNVGAGLGEILGGYVSQIVGRRREFIAAAVLALIVTPFALPFWMLPSVPSFAYMAVFGFLAGCTISGCYGALAAYFSERYPTELRATGSAGCFNLGQIVGGFSPALLALVVVASAANVKNYTAGMVYFTIGALIVMIIVRLFSPETRGVDLELYTEEAEAAGTVAVTTHA